MLAKYAAVGLSRRQFKKMSAGVLGFKLESQMNTEHTSLVGVGFDHQRIT